MSETNVPKVYAAISQVQAELARAGLAKLRKNAQQGFMFRGIDDVYNIVATIMASNNLVMLPRHVSRESDVRTTAKGGTLTFTNVVMEYDLVSALDGSKHTVSAFGEAMDSGDKSTNKAMSAAHKYAIIQAFTIPTEGDNDPDATAHGEDESQSVNEALLVTLRNAAMDGPEILKKAFDLNKDLPGFAVTWTRYGESLKSAAAQAQPA
ncbi:MAG: ERF family protein [Anaerolineales bacterium]|nr:ERF family protein [Anaerolineales bacterium]